MSCFAIFVHPLLFRRSNKLPLFMIEQLQITRLRASTLFQIYFIGFICTLYPIAIIFGTAAAFGADTLKRGDVQVHGWKAIVDMIVAPPIFALFFALFWLVFTWPGLWLFSKFRMLPISFYADAPNHALQRTATSGELPGELHAPSAGSRR